MAGGLAGMGGIQNKETMQSLSNHLASYLDRVMSLETENQKLESKIREHLEKKGPQVDNACLAADDFRVKYETELAMGQPVESNIHGFRKVTDDTNVIWLQLETEMEVLKEELLFIKNHKDENGEKLDKYWSQQIEETTTVVTIQSAEVGVAEMTLTELRHTVQSLKINLDSMGNMKTSLENSLREVEALYALKMDQLNGILLHPESELTQTQAEGQRQAQEYEALLNI
ncbi:Keratin, type I cytoskeletal 18 [Saguinus oedipus]|uniref:Keratin, type I cytoskeletal 18 n=1 Tax=Saguinus oedipus TaxID=9490 RepID=A0ABQ9VHA9_SAGOE|nr:Keratin, type I cytoskeletal 18 [Saguinus oedipus]